MNGNRIRVMSFLLAAVMVLASGCAKDAPVSQPDDDLSAVSATDATDEIQPSATDTTENNGTASSSVSQSTGTSGTAKTKASSVTQATKTNKTTLPTTAATTRSVMDELAAAPRWKQTKFYLSTFNATAQCKSADVYRKCLIANQEAGINLIENSIMATNDLITCMDICEELGLDFLAQDISQFSGMGTSYPANNPDMLYDIVERYSHYKHLVGYFLWDEPSDTNFRQYTVKRDVLKNYDPGSLMYSLLLPSYGAYAWDPNNVDDSAYKKYVDTYVSECDPDVLSVDYYPLMKGNESLQENNLWRDLGYFRYQSLHTGKPLWFYFQASKFQKELTDAQVQVQMYAALAYGTVGLSYYSTNGSLTDANGNRTARYEGLKALNQKVLHLGNLLFSKKDGGLYHTGLSESLVSAYSLNSTSESQCLFSAAPGGLIVGTFTDSKNTYLVIVNKDYNASVSGTMTLKKAWQISAYDLIADKFGTASSANQISLSIPAGDCAVYRLA